MKMCLVYFKRQMPSSDQLDDFYAAQWANLDITDLMAGVYISSDAHTEKQTLS